MTKNINFNFSLISLNLKILINYSILQKIGRKNLKLHVTPYYHVFWG